ncbi:hypothetical protein HRR75_000782 [Exophiala dermatitidis]|nr:hypothetical protein HRR75_000782 [Exophiala dermatitidis]
MNRYTKNTRQATDSSWLSLFIILKTGSKKEKSVPFLQDCLSDLYLLTITTVGSEPSGKSGWYRPLPLPRPARPADGKSSNNEENPSLNPGPESESAERRAEVESARDRELAQDFETDEDQAPLQSTGKTSKRPLQETEFEVELYDATTKQWTGVTDERRKRLKTNEGGRQQRRGSNVGIGSSGARFELNADTGNSQATRPPSSPPPATNSAPTVSPYFANDPAPSARLSPPAASPAHSSEPSSPPASPTLGPVWRSNFMFVPSNDQKEALRRRCV